MSKLLYEDNESFVVEIDTDEDFDAFMDALYGTKKGVNVEPLNEDDVMELLSLGWNPTSEKDVEELAKGLGFDEDVARDMMEMLFINERN